MSSNNRSDVPEFHNVRVTVTPAPHGDGNTLGRRFHVECENDPVTVSSQYAVINYQLVGATPAGIVFEGFDKSRASPTRQLSAPSISADGKMMTFNDRNSVSEPILIVLRLRDDTISLYDPEVTNSPQPSAS